MERPARFADLPRTDDVRPPARYLLHSPLRQAAGALVRRRWDIELRGVEHFPSSGPVVVAANHIGFLDGPLMAILGPRPVHALTKREMFEGGTGTFLTASGQIPIWRQEPDPAALRTALRVLRDGNVVGVFPEGTRGGGAVHRVEGGAAWLALATGAAVVPLSMLGTREVGGSLNSVPPPGTRMVMSYGAPLPFPQQGWPRRRDDVRSATKQIRRALLETMREAEQATGLALPGPIPPTSQKEQL
ncbi:MAG TPA: lysophospholipid acyltransferase family protein [Marmoricola sp.]|nr:lysophospholipid acyltransferase family protein [Marmoricola sp.]